MSAVSARRDAPVLETAHLRLRPHVVADFEALAAMWADDVVTKHIGGRAFTRTESWARLLRYAGLWPLLGFGMWAIEDKASGRFAGDVGFADYHRDMTPPLHAPEAGWVLAPWAHGRGLATEAVSAAVAWADVHVPSPSTCCIIDVDHAASFRVATKCGYVQQGRGALGGVAVAVFERLRRE